MRDWTAHHWLCAITGAATLAVVTGIVTDLIPNPFFTRMIAAPWWSYPVWIASSVLSGALIATYATDRPSTEHRTQQRRGILGTVLSFLAVGCPTCNHLVVLALGTQGALTWFGPMQPALAIGALALLGIALRARLRTASSCPAATPR